MFVLSPFFARERFVLAILTSAVLLTGTYSVAKSKRMVWIGLGFLAPVLAARWIHVASEPHSTTLALAGLVFIILFLIYFSALILREVLSHRQVTFNTVTGAICVYLLLGYIFAFLFAIVETIQPGAFAISEVHGIAENTLAADDTPMLTYFSFVTMTTLGYGDITPITPITRMLATLEAIVGQLYLAAFVARLVGSMVSTRNAKD